MKSNGTIVANLSLVLDPSTGFFTDSYIINECGRYTYEFNATTRNLGEPLANILPFDMCTFPKSGSFCITGFDEYECVGGELICGPSMERNALSSPLVTLQQMDDYIQIISDFSEGSTINATVFDLQGREILHTQYLKPEGKSTYKILIPQESVGLHFLRLSFGDHTTLYKIWK
ncbi:MAG: hypothetical protein AAFY76_05345 [Cyanobacteria bacterium J06649_11]